ncbi:MAG: hypothetical protein S4CHLAM2_13310 [Chlamydiales bacterium]|nr:hypothetical protein [Chlamydiales bacterium]
MEYLYFKPSIYDPYFVIPEGNNEDEPGGTRFANNFSFHSGVRVKGALQMPCSQLKAYSEGLYLKDSTNRFLAFPDQQALGTKGDTEIDIDDLVAATSQSRYRLWSIKGGFSHAFAVCSPFNAMLSFGINYTSIILREKILYLNVQGESNFVDASMRGWAIGPELALDASYPIFSCLSFVVKGSYALLVGQSGASIGTREVGAAGNVIDNIYAQNERRSVVCPVSELKAGVKLASFCLWCLRPSIEIGYDVLCYNNMIDFIRWCGDASTEGLSFDHFTPFMVHGLYASANVAF